MPEKVASVYESLLCFWMLVLAISIPGGEAIRLDFGFAIVDIGTEKR
jgi:hypothetical protein